MAYGLKYSQYLEKGGVRLQIKVYQKDYTGASYGMAHITGAALQVVGGQSDVLSPTLKTAFSWSLADCWDEGTTQADGTTCVDATGQKCGKWEEFYTNDATKYKVELSVLPDGGTASVIWTGFVTPDSWSENLIYRGSVTITARDMLGALRDREFSLTGRVSVLDIVQGALAACECPMALSYTAGHFLVNADGSSILDHSFAASAFSGDTWQTALDETLESLGLVLRYNGVNGLVLTSYRYIKADTLRGMHGGEFTGRSGLRALDPAIKEIVDVFDVDFVSYNAPDPKEEQFSRTGVTITCSMGSGSQAATGQLYAYNLTRADGEGWAGNLAIPLYGTIGAGVQARGLFFPTNVQDTQNNIEATYINPRIDGGFKFSIEQDGPLVLSRNGATSSATFLPYTGAIAVSDISVRVEVTSGGTTSYLHPEGGWTNELTYLTIQPGEEVEVPVHNSGGTYRIVVKQVRSAGIMDNVRPVAPLLAALLLNIAPPANSTSPTEYKVTTIYNEDNNVTINRTPSVGSAGLGGCVDFYENVLALGDTLAANQWNWPGESDYYPLAVMVQAQVLCYYSAAASVFTGTLHDTTADDEAALPGYGVSYYQRDCVAVNATYDFVSGLVGQSTFREVYTWEQVWGASFAPQYTQRSGAGKGSTSATGAGGSSVNPGGGGGYVPGGGTNYWEIDGTLNTLLKPKDAYAYVHSKDGLFFTGAALSGTVVPDLYVDVVNNQRVLRSPLPLITGGDQIVISGTPGGGGGGGGATTLAGLDDTNISNPQAGQMLSWNGTKWVNTNAPTGSITSVSLAAGATNGTLHLVVNGTAQSDVAVTGLGSMAYKSSLVASDIPDLSATYQPKDADLTAIAGLSGTSGFLKKTAANTWSLDTNTYLTGITSAMVTNALGYTPANVTALANYLPLAGGTLTNSEREILKLNQETTSTGIVGPYIRFSLNNGIRAGVGYNSSIGAFIENYFTVDGVGSNAYVNLDNSGVLKHNNTQPYLHTGNYSSYLDSVYHPYGGGNIAFQTSTLAASGQVTITGNFGVSVAGLVINNNTNSTAPWLITAHAPNAEEGGYGGSIIFGKANSSCNTGVIDFYYAGNGSTSNYVGVGLFYKDDLLKVYGTGVTEVKSLKIGSATITWNSNGYLHIDQPLVTAGDQIVISGTPGGGGGGGATNLWGLDDVNIPHGSTTPSNGQVLTWDSTLAKWTNQSITSGVSSVVGQTGAVTAAQIATALTGAGYKLTDTTYSAGTGLTLNGTQFSVTANTYAPYNANGYLPLTGGTLKNSTREILTLNQETSSTGETGAYISFRTNGTTKAAIGYNSNLGIFFQSGTVEGLPYVNIDNSGEFKYKNTYTFLHSGNYTDYVNTTNFPGLMGNQTITLSGDVSGSGATSITTTIGEGKVTNAMLAGSIENSKLNTIGVSKGGTGLTTWTGAYRLVYSTAATTLTTLAPNSTTTRKFLRQVGANNAATAPAWDTVTKTDVGLSNVENTALSTWAGTSSITTLGTITTGVWQGSAIANTYLANSSITINGSSTSLGGSFSTASITAGTAGQSGASTGVSFSIPYVTMNKYGIVTAYGTHTHTISATDLTTTIGSTTYAAYHAAGYVKKDGDTMTSSSRDILTLNQNTTSTGQIGPYIHFKTNNSNSAAVGYNSALGAFLGNETVTNSPYVNLDNSGVFKLNNNHTFYHSGNSNLSTVPWACSTLTASGSATIGGGITFAGGLLGSNTAITNRSALLLNSTSSHAADIIFRSGTYTSGTYGDWAITSRGAEGSNNDFMIFRGAYNSGNASEAGIFAIKPNGYVIIGQSIYGQTANAQLDVRGGIVSTGDQVVSSDLTLKTNLTPVTYSVSDIAKARAVEFDWKDGRGHSMGSIAQDWLGIAPTLVHGKEGNMSLAYGQLALVNTILLARQSESHEARIKELEARVAELEIENERLRMN